MAAVTRLSLDKDADGQQGLSRQEATAHEAKRKLEAAARVGLSRLEADAQEVCHTSTERRYNQRYDAMR